MNQILVIEGPANSMIRRFEGANGERLNALFFQVAEGQDRMRELNSYLGQYQSTHAKVVGIYVCLSARQWFKQPISVWLELAQRHDVDIRTWDGSLIRHESDENFRPAVVFNRRY